MSDVKATDSGNAEIGFLASFALFGHFIQSGKYSLGRTYAKVTIHTPAKSKYIPAKTTHVQGLIVRENETYPFKTLERVFFNKLAVFGSSEEEAKKNFEYIKALYIKAQKASHDDRVADKSTRKDEAIALLKGYITAIENDTAPGTDDAVDIVLENLPLLPPSAE